jgi:polysaccharide export outer membrane protein
MRIAWTLRTLGFAAAWALSLGCGTPPVPPEFSEQTVEESEFHIAPADVLEVRVWKNPEITVQQPVLPDGTISVPLAGVVTARGLTTAQLEDVLAEKLSEYITAPEVSVVVTQVNSKRVAVIGEVVRVGPQDLGLNSRIMDALANAGGFTPYSNKRKIKLIRRVADGGEIAYWFNYERYRGGSAPGTNVLLQPGDVIVVSD